MRDVLGGFDDREGLGQDARIGGRFIASAVQPGIALEPSSDRLVRGNAAQHALAPGVAGVVEAVQQGLEIAVAVDGDAEHLALHG